jgi:glucokinase
MAILGLDIGGTKILGALFNKKGIIIDKEKKASRAEDGQEVFLNQVYKVIDNLLERSDDKVKGIGIGFPGIVDAKGFVVFAPNLPIKKYDLAADLRKRYGVEVRIGNDVNMGTFGEYKELQIDFKNVIGIFPGTGLGGGIIIDGDLYIGQGFAGELGHIVVQRDGVQCSCGNYGCLESYASKKGIISYILNQEKRGRVSTLLDDAYSGVVKSSKLRKACDEKDPVVIDAMEQFVDYLGMGIGSVINVFNPDLVIVGGGIIDSFGDELLEDIKKHTKAHSMTGMYKNTKIEKSKLGDDAVIYGAYHLVKAHIKKNK